MNIPTYYINIDDEGLGMSAISLVEYPAIERDFVKLAEQKPLQFSADEEKRELFGPALIADKPIYRRNGSFEYYVVFTADVIKQIAERYSKNNLWCRVNLQHQEDTFVEGVTMLETYLKNEALGISPKGFEDVADGSLFVRFKVEDENLWNVLKSDEFKGFSVEITADLEEKFSEMPNAPQSLDDEVEELFL